MKVIYSEEEPDNYRCTEYETVDDFLIEHPKYKVLLSDGREKLETTVMITVHDYPLQITINLKK